MTKISIVAKNVKVDMAVVDLPFFALLFCLPTQVAMRLRQFLSHLFGTAKFVHSFFLIGPHTAATLV